MITVKKDAIKFKTPDGMQSVGALANVGTFGVNAFQYMRTIDSTFRSAKFPTGTELVIDCTNDLGNTINSFQYAFCSTTGIKKIKILANATKVLNNVEGTSMYYAFSSSTDLEVVDVSGIIPLKPRELRYAFYNSVKIREVIGEFDCSLIKSGYTSYAFLNMKELVEIRFKENTNFYALAFTNSSKLSILSIQSIIDSLATVEEAQTLTFHKNIEEKLTDEQKAQITSKNWNLAFK